MKRVNAVDRRHFLAACTAAGISLSHQSALPASSPPRDAASFTEPQRAIVLHDDADVIVCGGGPAGSAAAVAAARAGAKTRLFEVLGCLGGVWTAGLLTYIFDFDKPGLPRRLAAQLDARNARVRGTNRDRFVYDPEAMKVLLEDLLAEAGAQFRLQSRVVAAYRDGNRLKTIVTESRSGREAWRAKVFIDATGDGDLGALAGCDWEFGRIKDCPCQPMTLNALVVVKDAAALKDHISFYGGDGRVHLAAVEKNIEAFRRAGIEPSYGHPTLFHIYGNLLEFMVNHEYGVRPFDADAVTAATVRARAEVHRLAAALRKLGGPWEDLHVAATAEQIGIRDGRRIRGRYVVTQNDLTAGARHEDAVARVTFPVDIHAASKEENAVRPIWHGDLKFKPYDIPLRALMAKDVDGLLLAGRCISGDFFAHASYRVTGNAVAMGEAAGVVAALAAQTNRAPHDIPWADALAAMKRIGLRD